jgi:hypothetical protein
VKNPEMQMAAMRQTGVGVARHSEVHMYYLDPHVLMAYCVILTN